MTNLKRKKYTPHKAGLSSKTVISRKVYPNKKFAGIPIRLKKKTYEYVKLYANSHGMKIPEVAEKAFQEFIDDRLDLKLYEEAMIEYNNDPVAYTVEEVERKLGL